MSVAERLASIAVLATACATGNGVTPSESTTTLMAGWERHFTLEWTVEVEQDGTRRLRGYVQNQHGEAVCTYEESVLMRKRPAGKGVTA